jgi:serine/threonine-protein kinase PknK
MLSRLLSRMAGDVAANEQVPGYRDLRPIARGGFSLVYRAYQEALGREVALKVVTVAVDEGVRRRFLREVALTSRLTGHPNVVTVLDTGLAQSGRPYLAMDLHQRGSLVDRLGAEGPLPAVEVARVGARIASALHAAHQVGVIHRDVKPSNILISRYGEPVLSDFGVASLVDDQLSATMASTFTLRHAAPELVDGGQPTPACDLYALGSTLYELLAGRPAFGGRSMAMAALLQQILTATPGELHCPELPALVDVIKRAMAKRPADRYPSAAALSAALDALVPAGTVPAVPSDSSGPFRPTGQPPRTAPLGAVETEQPRNPGLVGDSGVPTGPGSPAAGAGSVPAGGGNPAGPGIPAGLGEPAPPGAPRGSAMRIEPAPMGIAPGLTGDWAETAYRPGRELAPPSAAQPEKHRGKMLAAAASVLLVLGAVGGVLYLRLGPSDSALPASASARHQEPAVGAASAGSLAPGQSRPATQPAPPPAGSFPDGRPSRGTPGVPGAPEPTVPGQPQPPAQSAPAANPTQRPPATPAPSTKPSSQPPSKPPTSKPSQPPSKPPQIAVDGQFGPQTIAALQRALNTRYHAGLHVDGEFGALTKKAMQRALGVSADGQIGPVTVKALQRHVGAAVDGQWGSDTTRHLQRALNAGRF